MDLLIQEHAKRPDNPWLFPSSQTGAMYHPNSAATLHQRIPKDAGLGHLRFQDPRHTFAALAFQSGVDIKTVSTMLGHYNAGSTLRTCTHTTRQKQDEGAQTIRNLMAQVQQSPQKQPSASDRKPDFPAGALRFFASTQIA